MDDGDKVILRHIAEQVEENHKMLRKLYRAHLWSRFMTLFYWLLIIGISLGTFYFLQPYLEKVLAAYDAVRVQFDTLQDTGKQVGEAVTKFIPGGQ